VHVADGLELEKPLRQLLGGEIKAIPLMRDILSDFESAYPKSPFWGGKGQKK
jgi:hypothetical protein